MLLLILVDSSGLASQFLYDPLSVFRETFIFFIGSAFVTVIPTLISYTKGVWKKYVAYGVAAISLLTVIGGFIQMNTCTGKMCGLLGLIHMIGVGIVLVFFSLSYAITEYAAPKKNFWMYFVLALEVVAIAWLVSNIW